MGNTLKCYRHKTQKDLFLTYNFASGIFDVVNDIGFAINSYTHNKDEIVKAYKDACIHNYIKKGTVSKTITTDDGYSGVVYKK